MRTTISFKSRVGIRKDILHRSPVSQLVKHLAVHSPAWSARFTKPSDEQLESEEQTSVKMGTYSIGTHEIHARDSSAGLLQRMQRIA